MIEQIKNNSKLLIIGACCVIGVIVLFVVFQHATKVNAPTVADSMDIVGAVDIATTTTDIVEQTPAPVTPTPVVKPTTNTNLAGEQVIQGDGFTAIVRPVTGIVPKIKTFTMEKRAAGCVFAWDVKDAASCDVRNVTERTSIKGVPSEGSLQTKDAGSYQLQCKSADGVATSSAVIACQ